MNLQRIAVLVRKEFGQNSRSLTFVLAIVVPVLLSLVIALFFGTIFSGRPKLGVADLGNSRLTALLRNTDYLVTRVYDSPQALKAAAEAGAVDAGIVLPAGIDDLLVESAASHIDIYVWGQSLLKNRGLIASALGNGLITVAGKKTPVEIVSEELGSGVNIAWEKRLLPLIVLMTIVIGGAMLPATALVEEKQKQTLRAVSSTSAGLGEIFFAKAVLGVSISLLMGVVVLVINQAFGAQPLLLVGVLALGAIFSALLGLLLGAYMKDVNTLFATIKAAGILLYAPALPYLFPQIPQWVGKIFPTYYFVAPVVEITQNGAGFGSIAWMLAVLVGLIAALWAAAGLVARSPERVLA